MVYFTALAQNYLEDVIYLKHGGIIRGVVIEQIPGPSAKIQTIGRNVFVFYSAQIEKITRELITPDQFSNSSSGVRQFKNKGYINITELNFCSGVGAVTIADILIKNTEFSYGFRTVNGYQFNEHYSLGLGLGLAKFKYATFFQLRWMPASLCLKGKPILCLP